MQVWLLNSSTPLVTGPPGDAGGPVFALAAVVLVAGCYLLLDAPVPGGDRRMSAITLATVSRWYGDVVAVNDVTMTIGPGITGLLGPNGAGKSTLISMMAGFLAPSAGTVELDGAAVWRHEQVYRQIGIVPETEAAYDVVTGAAPSSSPTPGCTGWPSPGPQRQRAIELVDMAAAADREIGTYSKGMKQRIKMASALVHDPAVLLLDEPFNGMDPRQRLHLMDLLTRLGVEGRTVLFSSHILEEVEEIAGTIEVMVAGRHAASGDFREIRRLMTERPHSSPSPPATTERSPRPSSRTAAHRRSSWGTPCGCSRATTGRFVHDLPRLARDGGIRLYSVAPADESLESVFAYLVTR